MEVSNEIKEDIRKTQSELKNAIRIHQVWVARLQEDENNAHLKSKVKDAEKEIITIGQTQKRVVDRLRRELELYQQRLKAKNKIVNVENDNKYVAQQLRDHQIQYKNKNRPVSLLKSSVLTEIHIKTENGTDDKPPSVDGSDSENEIHFKDNCIDNDKQSNNCTQFSSVHDSRNNFVNALNKVKETLNNTNPQHAEWVSRSPESGSSGLSPSPSPPPLPAPGEPITQETFLRSLLPTANEPQARTKKKMAGIDQMVWFFTMITPDYARF
ncbi:hypothetical protein EVAR_2438_1 [Eumeta japonica]|uniref:Uncharacterized protein n=1 Tax=Eumeta variegata TaxID=151549 RepID=A0A4C1SNN0_EUMVA|nr:hypothetical protein EVAR_2438_1 [Eumeta japonica]